LGLHGCEAGAGPALFSPAAFCSCRPAAMAFWHCCAPSDEGEAQVSVEQEGAMGRSGFKGQFDPSSLKFEDEHVGAMLGTIENSGGAALKPGEFVVEIVKDSDGAGLEIESIASMLLVAKLKRGPIRVWNQTRDPELCVRAGDRIVSVNGVEAEGNMLIEELRKDLHLRLVLRHPKEFKVSVDKGGKELGMCVVGGNAKLDMLKISALKEGAVDDWNKVNVDNEVIIGDRITAVNSVMGDPQKMLAELKSKERLELTIIRPY